MIKIGVIKKLILLLYGEPFGGGINRTQTMVRLQRGVIEKKVLGLDGCTLYWGGREMVGVRVMN